MPITLSCSTICFRDQPVDVAIAEVVAAGFSALDLAVIPGFCDHFDPVISTPAERADFVALVRSSGLAVPTVTAVPGHFNAPGAEEGAIVRAARSYLKLAALVGAPSLNLHCGAPIGDRHEFHTHALAQARGLKRIAQEAADLHLSINVEAPHRNGLCRSLEEATVLLDRINEPNVNFLLDVTHVQAGGAHPAEAVHAFGDRLGHIHLRDGKGEEIFFVPGEGDIDFAAFFAALEQAGYNGYCAIELEGYADTLEERRRGVASALTFLRSERDLRLRPSPGAKHG